MTTADTGSGPADQPDSADHPDSTGQPGRTEQSPFPDPEAKKKVLNRLRRAQGQLTAVIGAVEDDSHCREVVQQLAAVSKALDRAGFLVISHALRQCMTDPDGNGAESPEELEKLFLSLA